MRQQRASELVVDLDEVIGEAEEVGHCQDCGGGQAVHVEHGEWHVVQLHDVPCPATRGAVR